jgi:hypothetical protein
MSTITIVDRPALLRERAAIAERFQLPPGGFRELQDRGEYSYEWSPERDRYDDIEWLLGIRHTCR